jgi:hypothetical protein
MFQGAEFLDYQEQNHVFQEIIGGSFEDVLQTTGEGTEQYQGGSVTPNMFQFLGVPALFGRTLLPTMRNPGRPRSLSWPTRCGLSTTTSIPRFWVARSS